MKLSAILAPLVAAGVDGETLLKTVIAFESQQENALEKRREADRERQARKRQNDALSRDVTLCHSDRQRSRSHVRENEIPQGRGEDNLQTKNQAGKKNKQPLGSSAHADEPFARFWAAYPKREGPNPKKPAKLVFDRLVAKGRDPDTIIASANAYATDNPTPTRFIAQAVTWLNQERFEDEPEDQQPIAADDDRWPRRLSYARQHQTWSQREWGPPPGAPGCLVPRHLLEHGDGVGWAEWKPQAA